MTAFDERLQQLTPLHKSVLMLFDVFEWDVGDVASALKVHPEGIRHYYEEARAYVRGEVEEPPGDPYRYHYLSAENTGDREILRRHYDVMVEALRWAGEHDGKFPPQKVLGAMGVSTTYSGRLRDTLVDMGVLVTEGKWRPSYLAVSVDDAIERLRAACE